MGIGRVALIVFSIATIFSIGLTNNLAYGVVVVDPLCVINNNNSLFFENNFVHASWEILTNAGPIVPDLCQFVFDTNSVFSLFTGSPFTGPVPTANCDESDICTFQIPNFVDELDTKIIFIDITFAGDPQPIPFPQQGSPTVTCNDSSGTSDGMFLEQGLDSPGLFIYDFKCIPNPDWEEITIQLGPNVLFVEIWTTSFDLISIGGTMVPIDTTALLFAGVQSISMWMIPVVVAGIGIGVFMIKRRK